MNLFNRDRGDARLSELRKLLKRESRRMERAGKTDTKEQLAIQAALDDHDTLVTLHNAVMDHHDDLAANESSASSAAEVERGPVTDFLDWLFSHSDQIIAMLVKIIGLFSDTEPRVEQAQAQSPIQPTTLPPGIQNMEGPLSSISRSALPGGPPPVLPEGPVDQEGLTPPPVKVPPVQVKI